MSQQEIQGERILSSKINIGLEQLSLKQQKVVLGLIKEMGFTKEEIAELIIRIGDKEITGSE